MTFRSCRRGRARRASTLSTSPPGTAEGDARLVGTGVATRTYQGPASLSSLQFLRDSRAALVNAGWKVLYPTDDKGLTELGSLVAHFDKSGRDVWAKLYFEPGASLTYSVADVGSEDWAAKLAKDCRLPLYGVFFDFNKATLKPESDTVLKKAAALLVKAQGFAVEVQGHTDNVGGDDYNLTLSGARAEAVKTWLGKHGVAGSRLSSTGFGKTQPIADNGADEGRAKNRRVELVKVGCGKP
jgi:outer membrane protein OmpA-like peptidoglycan-associated protein